MLAYSYDENKYYAGVQECQLDPLETEKAGHYMWLLPANCVWAEPLEEKDGCKVKWNGEEWEYELIPIPPEPEQHEPKQPTLYDVKTEKITELKAARDRKEVENIYIDGYGMFDYDDKSRERLSIARQALQDAGGGEIEWTTAENQRVTVDVSVFAKINSIAAERSNLLHIKYNELKEEVNACETMEEVEAIVWAE